MRLIIPCIHSDDCIFQSTHLVWGATINTESYVPGLWISIHAPRVRCDGIFKRKKILLGYFNPRTSCEVRQPVMMRHKLIVNISIHAPRVRCDQEVYSFQTEWRYFNPRTSCEVRQKRENELPYIDYFNPRTSCEVRRRRRKRKGKPKNISIHAPRVRCDVFIVFSSYGSYISIHAPRVRCDKQLKEKIQAICIFQSTHLVWGATLEDYYYYEFYFISIHAPRVRCDRREYKFQRREYNFNPRTSCEVRPNVRSLPPV